MSYRATYRLSARTTTAVTVSPRSAALACAARHRSSGTRMFRSGVGMSVDVRGDERLLDEDAAALPRQDELPRGALGGGEGVPVGVSHRGSFPVAVGTAYAKLYLHVKGSP